MDANSRLRLLYASIGTDADLIIIHGGLKKILNDGGVDYEN